MGPRFENSIHEQPCSSVAPFLECRYHIQRPLEADTLLGFHPPLSELQLFAPAYPSSSETTSLNGSEEMNPQSPPSEGQQNLTVPPRNMTQSPSLQRPSLARLSATSAAHHSSPSIMTMSKMYQERKQQHPQTQGNSPPVSPPAPKLSPTGGQRFGQANKSKKLQKKVLTSKPDYDYFNPHRSTGHDSSGMTSPSPPSEGHHLSTSKLPSFQTYSGLKSDLDSESPQLKHNKLSSSKIYERRMKQLHEDDEDEDDQAAGINMSEDMLDTDDIDRRYQEKLGNMSKRSGKAEFYQGSSEDDESDVDINSDTEDPPAPSPTPTQRPTPISRPMPVPARPAPAATVSRAPDDMLSTTQTFRFPADKGATAGSSSSSSSSESKPSGDHDLHQKKRNFLHRLAFGDHDDLKEISKDDNLLSRIVNFGGGGMIPNSTIVRQESPKKSDEEAKIENDIPLNELSPEVFKKEAAEILKTHGYAGSSSSSRDHAHSDSTTLDGSKATYYIPNNADWNVSEEPQYADNLDGGDAEYIAPPDKVRGGVLSSLLKLYEQQGYDQSGSKLHSSTITPTGDSNSSFIDARTLTDKLKSYAGYNPDNESIHRRAESFIDLRKFKPTEGTGYKQAPPRPASTTNLPSFNRTQKPRPEKPKATRVKNNILPKKRKEQARAKITVHIADVLQRQAFILRMCKALMLYGAPTHRLEEYLTMTSRVLEIDGQFIYFPGCMVVSFGDPITRTSEVQLVKCTQGLNLYKLHRIHRIYKQVVHDMVSVDDASVSLEELLAEPATFPPWMCVLLYGFSSSMVTPFAFGGGWVNLPVAFGIGCLVGILQFLIAPRSQLYINVFEVSASIVVSFVGRALGSIEGSGICFASVVQGSLALILPGWLILCGALELQSRNLVAGSVRMFYAIIYSLFLGYGITLGSALYGWIDHGATSETTCSTRLSDWYRFLFVPGFTVGLALINQARLFQLPVIIIIAACGHVVSYFAAKHFYNSTQITAAMASFVIGVLGNLYSRIFKGIAFSAMLPAVFVQIPSGISSADSLLSGVRSANQIVTNATTSATEQAFETMSVGVTLINVCIGITVGLFVSAIVVYPFGKTSTSIFTL